ncbi:hypothetical protein KEM56_005623 [Ascosphaera pollenicola]|nr:hypothetical protein KEM56_005623 [Ascosphaera pollenicola]
MKYSIPGTPTSRFAPAPAPEPEKEDVEEDAEDDAIAPSAKTTRHNTDRASLPNPLRTTSSYTSKNRSRRRDCAAPKSGWHGCTTAKKVVTSRSVTSRFKYGRSSSPAPTPTPMPAAEAENPVALVFARCISMRRK